MSPKTTSQNYSLDELRVREYIRLLIANLASTVVSVLRQRYQKFVDTEKIRFTNTKKYQREKRKNLPEVSIQDCSAKLDYWVPVTEARSNNDPHITYSSYDGGSRVFDLNMQIDGFCPSMTEDAFYKKQLEDLFYTLSRNSIIDMLQEYMYNNSSWETSSCFDDFCHSNIQNCCNIVNQSLQEFDKHLSLKPISRNQIETPSHFYVSPQKIEACFLRESFYCKQDLPQIIDECEIDVLLIEQNKKSHFIIYTRIYLAQKALIGKRVGDTFTLPNIPHTYKILRIY